MATINNKTRPRKKTSRSKGKTSNRHVINVLREGRPVSLDFFRRHAWLILIAVVVVLALIGQRYSNQDKRLQIKRLEHALATAESELVAQKASYMSLIRENEMRHLLRSHNINLDYQEQPPYVLSE